MVDDDPFAQFAFNPPVKRQRSRLPPPHPPSPSQHAVPTASCTCSSPLASKDAPLSVRRLPSTNRYLSEYALISSFREQRRTSVDDFHEFLLTLGCGGVNNLEGRFWAVVACLLSVQCRDTVALETTQALMERYAGGSAAEKLAALPIEELEEQVKRCNFFRTKAKHVQSAALHATCHGGQVPSTYDGLLTLDGVGPKIAHLLRSVVFGHADAGIVVDTHVHRVRDACVSSHCRPACKQEWSERVIDAPALPAGGVSARLGRSMHVLCWPGGSTHGAANMGADRRTRRLHSGGMARHKNGARIGACGRAKCSLARHACGISTSYLVLRACVRVDALGRGLWAACALWRWMGRSLCDACETLRNANGFTHGEQQSTCKQRVKQRAKWCIKRRVRQRVRRHVKRRVMQCVERHVNRGRILQFNIR